MNAGERVFVDTGAWVGMAVSADRHHEVALEGWDKIMRAGAVPVTSHPVVIETFTYLQRSQVSPLAQVWVSQVNGYARLVVLELTSPDLAAAWPGLERPELPKLGIVDATSFALMKKHRIRTAFTFDRHFALAGFRML